MSFRTDVDRRFLERGQVRTSPARLASVTAPSPFSLGIAAASVLSTIPGICFAIWALIGDGPPAGDDVAAAVGSLACMALPPMFLLLLPAVVVAGSNGARALYGIVGALLSAAFGATLAVGMLIQGQDATAGLWLGLMAALPWGALGLIAATVAWLQFNASLRQDRKRRALLLLERFGSLTEGELVTGVGGSPGALWASLRELHAKTPLRHEHGRVWTARRLAARQALLLARVEGGMASLHDLSNEVREPVEIVRCWLDELRDAEVLQFELADDRITFGGIGVRTPCGGCGGPMKAVGGRMLRCVHCGNEAVDA